jgi:hypothetical protein
VNADTGASGIPVSGDIAVIDTTVHSPAKQFGSDFNTGTAFGGLIYNTAPSGPSSNQGTFTLQADGMGIVANAALTGETHYFNSNVAFTGIGDAVVDIRVAGTLYVQKSFYGNENITLVKKGVGTLQHNQGYAPNSGGVYTEARDNTGGYYPNRKFVFKGVKLQEGVLDMRQYYWIWNCDFQFDGDGAGLSVNKLSPDLGVHSLELSGCKFRETENVTGTSHYVTANDPTCYIHFMGTMEDTSFSGLFKGSAGICWDPENDATFTFRKSVSPTTGILAVSNGTIRVAEGAGFTALSSVTVSGANSLFKVDADAIRDFSAPFALDNGGKIAVPDGIGVSVASLVVDGTSIEAGLYNGQEGLIDTTVDWIDGAGYVVVTGITEGERADETWTGTGGVQTPANWNGATELPALTGATSYVTVAESAVDDSVMHLDRNVWFKGMDVKPIGFQATADAGCELWLGSLGLATPAAQTFGLYAPTMLTAAQDWTIGSGGRLVVGASVSALAAGEHRILGSGGGGTLEINAETPNWTTSIVVSNLNVQFNASHALGSKSGAFATIYHNASAGSPTYAGGITVDRDLWFVDTSVAKNGTTKITVPANTNIVFNGIVTTTNTSALAISSGAGSTVTFNDLFMSRNAGSISGSGTMIFNGPYHCRDRFYMIGGTMELHATLNRFNGNMGLWNNGTIKTMVPYAVEASNKTRRFTTANVANNSIDADMPAWLNPSGSAVLDLCGKDQSVDQIALHSGGGTVTSETPATLHVIPSAGYWAKHNYIAGFTVPTGYSDADSYGYETTDKGFWKGAVTLSFDATNPARRFLMRASTSTGCVEVVSGILTFTCRAATGSETFDLKGGSSNPYPRLASEDGSWTNATELVIRGGTVVLEHSKAIGRQTDVRFEAKTDGTHGVLELVQGVAQKCHDLYIDGDRQGVGSYGSSESGAQYHPVDEEDNELFSGTGVLNVVRDGQGFMLLLM